MKTLRVLASKKYKKPHKLNSDYEFEVRERIKRIMIMLNRIKSL